MAKIKILLVDDHEVIINGLKQFVEEENNMEIVSTAVNGKDALGKIEMLKGDLDIVVTDINMPILSGVELTKLIKEKYPEIKVLVLTVYKEKSIIKELINAEVDGYILKNMRKSDFLTAIQHIYDGGIFYDNEIKDIIIELENNKKVDALNTELSNRENEILQLICNEYSSTQIAEKLFISLFTVETHRRNILKKTGAKSIVALIKYAVKQGMIE